MWKDTSLPCFMLFRVGHHHFLVIFRFSLLMTSQIFQSNSPSAKSAKNVFVPKMFLCQKSSNIMYSRMIPHRFIGLNIFQLRFLSIFPSVLNSFDYADKETKKFWHQQNNWPRCTFLISSGRFYELL